MNEHTRDSLVRHPWVTIEAAAELTDVDIPTLRGWARRGALVIEQRGDMEVVQLEEVRALASRERASRHGSLRDRLGQDGGMAPSGEVVNVADLQESARERSDDQR